MSRLTFIWVLILLGVACTQRVVEQGGDGATGGDAAPGLLDRGVADLSGPSSCTYERLAGPATVNSGTGNHGFSPSMVHTGSRFAMAWLCSDTVRHPVVRMRLAREDAALVGSEATVGPESHAWAELALAGSNIGLCWMTDPGMKGRVSFRLLNIAGVPQGQPVEVSLDYPTACTDLVPTPGGWAATISALHTLPGGTSDYRHALVRLDRSGKPLGAPRKFTDASARTNRLSLVRTSSGFLAAYTAANSSGGTTVRVQRFTADGQLKGAAQAITPESGRASYPRLVQAGSQTVALYRREGAADINLVLFQRLNAAGQAQGRPVELTTDGWAASLSAAWSGVEVALAWVRLDADPGRPTLPHPQARVMLARLRADGTRLQTDLELARPGSVQIFRVRVAGSPRRLGAVWDEHGGARGLIRLAVAGCRR